MLASLAVDTPALSLGAATLSPGLWTVFKEQFHVRDTRCLSP